MAKKLTKNINSGFKPTYIGNVPMYGFGGRMTYGPGGWMQLTDLQMQGIQQAATAQQITPTVGSMGIQQAGVVGEGIEQISNAYRPDKVNWGSNVGGGALKGAATGAALGSIVPGVGTVIGGAVGAIGGALSGVTKSFVKKAKLKQDEENQLLDNQQQQQQNIIAGLPQQVGYQMGCGGKIKAFGGLMNSYTNGGFTPDITDRISNVKNGGTHEQSSLGGVPMGNNALVEEGEVLYTGKNGKKYVFSNRF
jgi:uncharacterized membrane protein